jgi:hypothetical protein
MPNVTVRQALQAVADSGEYSTTDLTQMPVHELISHRLFEVANNPDASVRGSFTRANKARAMIFGRVVGKRRAGTAPAGAEAAGIEFTDLTAGALE